MERTIRVTGKGKLSVKPDQIRLIMDLEGSRESYEDTLELSTIQTEELKVLFHKIGFDKKDVKTISFNIDTKYESYQAKDKSWKRRFEGYEYRHTLKVEFEADNKILGRVLYALSHSSVTPEFKIIYAVKDMEQSKNQLLANAIADSLAKAKVLSAAANVNLGNIITIDYSWGEIEFTSSPMNKMLMPLEECCIREEAYDMDIDPDDIEVTDTVTVVWGIE